MNTKKQRPNKGFTLVEIMIALTIVSLLLTATAVAFNASMINFRENENMFKAVNTARQTLLRITTELRTAENVAIGEPSTRCSMHTAAGNDITYNYDADAQILYLITNDGVDGNDYVMCKNVTAISFDRVTVPDDASSIRSVQITITVSSGTVTETLSAATMIRRNLS